MTKKKETNGEHIRNMTDEEIATWIASIEARIHDNPPKVIWTKRLDELLDWVKAEAME